MKPRTKPASPLYLPPTERAMSLALSLAQAESRILEFTAGQVDAIVDPDGRTYLLRPAQESLRAREERLEAVVKSVADVLTVVDRGGVIVYQSAAAESVLGYALGELVGTQFFEWVHEEDLPQVHFTFSNIVERFQSSAAVQFRYQTQDGSYRLIVATAALLRDTSSDSVVFSMRPGTLPIGWQKTVPPVVVADPLPLAKDRFLAILSHELRTPLTPALWGIIELQRNEYLAEAQPTLAMIRRNIELQGRLLDHLADFTNLGQGKMFLRLEPVDVQEAIRNVLEICREEIATAHTPVTLDFRAAERMVLADSARLQQILWNLVKNAVKFSSPGGAISLSTLATAAGGLTIEIADHGMGIGAALLPLVFDCFQQGDVAGQPGHGGLGLGLYIARGLAAAQNGTLTVTSGGPGKGATFRLTLPMVSSDVGL